MKTQRQSKQTMRENIYLKKEEEKKNIINLTPPTAENFKNK